MAPIAGAAFAPALRVHASRHKRLPNRCQYVVDGRRTRLVDASSSGYQRLQDWHRLNRTLAKRRHHALAWLLHARSPAGVAVAAPACQALMHDGGQGLSHAPRLHPSGLARNPRSSRRARARRAERRVLHALGAFDPGLVKRPVGARAPARSRVPALCRGRGACRRPRSPRRTPLGTAWRTQCAPSMTRPFRMPARSRPPPSPPGPPPLQDGRRARRRERAGSSPDDQRHACDRDHVVMRAAQTWRCRVDEAPRQFADRRSRALRLPARDATRRVAAAAPQTMAARRFAANGSGSPWSLAWRSCVKCCGDAATPLVRPVESIGHVRAAHLMPQQAARHAPAPRRCPSGSVAADLDEFLVGNDGRPCARGSCSTARRPRASPGSESKCCTADDQPRNAPGATTAVRSTSGASASAQSAPPPAAGTRRLRRRHEVTLASGERQRLRAAWPAARRRIGCA